MNDQPPRRLFPHFSELPYSLRSLYTATLLLLGLGYLFALANLYFTYAGKAGGNPLMVSYEDIVVAYAGNDKASAIEDALNGPMSPMLPPEERDTVIAWARAGASQESYLSDIKPIIDKRCMACHDGSNPQLANFSNYDGVKTVTESRQRQIVADAGPQFAHPPVRDDLHLLRRGADVQPRLPASRMVQVRRHRTADRDGRDGHRFDVFDQALPSVRGG